MVAQAETKTPEGPVIRPADPRDAQPVLSRGVTAGLFRFDNAIGQRYALTERQLSDPDVQWALFNGDRDWLTENWPASWISVGNGTLIASRNWNAGLLGAHLLEISAYPARVVGSLRPGAENFAGPVRASAPSPRTPPGRFDFYGDGRWRSLWLRPDTAAQDIATLFDGDETWLRQMFPREKHIRCSDGVSRRLTIGFNVAIARDYLLWLAREAGCDTSACGVGNGNRGTVGEQRRPEVTAVGQQRGHQHLDSDGPLSGPVRRGDEVARASPHVAVVTRQVASRQGSGGGDQRSLHGLTDLKVIGRILHRLLHRVVGRPMVNDRHAAGNRRVPEAAAR